MIAKQQPVAIKSYEILSVKYYHLRILDPVCRTVTVPSVASHQNPNTNQRCIFPFTHNQTSYDKCIRTDEVNDFWCKTEKLTQGSQLDTDDNWGFCNDASEKFRGVI